MSADHGMIVVKLESPANAQCWKSFLNDLTAGDWSLFNRYGKTALTPLGAGLGDWEEFSGDIEGIFSIIRRKLIANERVALSLFFNGKDNHNEVIDVFESHKNTIIFSLSPASYKLTDSVVGDFSTYIDQIVPSCLKAFGPFQLECRQYIDRDPE